MSRYHQVARTCLQYALTVLVVYFLFASALVSPTLSPADTGQAHDIDEDPERVFYSDDPDDNNLPADIDTEDLDAEDVEAIEIDEEDKAVDSSRRPVDPNEIARQVDITYESTVPRVAVGEDETTLPEYRRNQLRSVERERDTSIVLERSPDTKPNFPNHYTSVIKDVHITHMGVVGGARPYTPVWGNEPPIFMGKSGVVLNYADFRIDNTHGTGLGEPLPPNQTFNGVRPGTCQVIPSYSTFKHEHTHPHEDHSYTDSHYGHGGHGPDPENHSAHSYSHTHSPHSGHEVDHSHTDIHRDSARAVCKQYFVDNVEMTRTLELPGETVTSDSDPNGRLLNYSGASEGRGELRLQVTVSASIMERTIVREWESHMTDNSCYGKGCWDSHDTSWANGEWEEVSDTVVELEYQEVTNEDAHDVVINSDDHGITQTVVNVSKDRNHVVISFDDPGGPVEAEYLTDRLLWNRIVFNRNYSVVGQWGVYSHRYEDNGAESRETDTTSTSPNVEDYHFPHVLQKRLTVPRHKPIALSYNDSGPSMKVLRNDTHPVVSWWTPLPSNVNLTNEGPVVYEGIMIADTPEAAQYVTTIHGERVDIPSEEGDPGFQRMEYVEPEIELEEVGSDDDVDVYRVRVLDPTKDYDPVLDDCTLHFQGVNRSVASLSDVPSANEDDYDADGCQTYVEIKQSLVSVHYQGTSLSKDEIDDTTDGVYYGSVEKRVTFFTKSPLVKATMDLVQRVLLISPLVFLYFWWRSFQTTG